MNNAPEQIVLEEIAPEQDELRTDAERTATAQNANRPRRGARLVRSVLTLMTGTLLAQVIGFGVTPLLTRLYDPADFGALGLLNAFAMLFVGVAALRFDMAIVVPPRERESANVLALSVIALLGTTALTLLIVALAREPVARWLGAPGLGDWLWLAPLIVFASGATNILSYWCTRKKEFRRISIANVLAAGASAGGKIAAASFGALGLIAGQIAGQMVAPLVLVWQVLRRDGAILRDSVSAEGIRSAAREHADFPVFQAPMTILNSVAQNLPVYFLGMFFGTREVGHWSLTVLVLSTPVFLISNAVRHVLFQRSSELYNAQKNLARLVWRSTLALAAVGIVPAIAGSLLSPWIFETLLGAEWEAAGDLARWAVFWQLTVLVGTPATAVFPVLRLHRVVFVWQACGIVLCGAALAAGGATGDPRTAVALYSGTMAALNVVLAVLVAQAAARSHRAARTPASDGGTAAG
jgi:O-antigen/teichoic acid export membrane protein